MLIRPFRPDDAPDLAALSKACSRGETDFVLNPLWEDQAELEAEFARFGIDPLEHLLVADDGAGKAVGTAGFLRKPGATTAGLFCPVVRRAERGHGIGGELLRATQELAARIGIGLAIAGIGTRNRAGYTLLSSHGFRPVRQHFLMRCDRRPELGDSPIDALEFSVAKAGDAAAILEIYAACGFEERTPETMSTLLEDGRHAHAVARHDGRIVAFAEIETHWPRRVWVAYVGVDRDLRDRGVGSHVVAWALGREFDAEATTALLMLSPANRTALRAYEKAGFRRHRLIDVLEKRI